MTNEVLVGLARQFYESLLDYRLHLTIALLHVHHHSDGDTTSDPFVGRTEGVLDGRHVTSLASSDKHGSVVAEAVAVVGIPVGWSGAAALISEEVVLGSELAGVDTVSLPVGELLGNHLGEQLLGLDERYLYVAVWVALESELTADREWEGLEESSVLVREVSEHVVNLLVVGNEVEVGLVLGEHIVELSDESLDGWDELDESLRNEDNAIVHTEVSTVGNDFSDIGYDVVKGLVLSFNLLAEQGNIGVSLESTLEGNVAGATTHELHEVPVLLGRVAVAHNVADHLRVNLCSGVEAERCLDLAVLEVAVDGLWAADNLNVSADGLVVFGEHAGIGVGVVTTNDYESLDVESLKDLKTLVELLLLLELGTAGTDDVETTGVAVLVDDVASELNVIVLNEAGRAEDEAVETVLGIEALDAVEETRDNIMTTRSLAAREDDAYVESSRVLAAFRGFEMNVRHTIGIGEEFLDLLLIVGRFGGFTFYDGKRATEGLRHLGTIS